MEALEIDRRLTAIVKSSQKSERSKVRPSYIHPPFIELPDGTRYPQAHQWTAADLMKWRKCQKCWWYAERADHVGECGRLNNQRIDRVFKTCNEFRPDDEAGLRALMLTKRQLQAGNLNLTEADGTVFHPCQTCGAHWMLADRHYCGELVLDDASLVPLDHPCPEARRLCRGPHPVYGSF